MSTWELEHFTNAAGTGTGDRRTIAAWGFILDLETRNWARGDLELTVRSGTAFSDNPTFGVGHKIVIWRNGSRVWHGWHVQPQRQLTAPAEARTYRFADAWYQLELYQLKRYIGQKNYVYTDTTIDLSGGPFTYPKVSGVTWETPSGDIVWTDWDDQSLLTVQGQIRRALYSAIWAGAPIAIGTIAVSMRAKEQDPNNQTCSSWVQSAARYAVNSVGWWDNSGATPVFNCCERAGATVYSHAFASAVETVTIAPLYDQQAFAVRLRYWYESYHASDNAGDDARPEGSGTLIIDIPVSEEVNAYQSKHLGIAAKMFAALSPLSWAGQIALHECATSLPWYRPGHALNLTGGRTELATMAAIVQQVSHHVGAEAQDTCSITLGAPTHLGVQDWFELANIGSLAGGAGGGGGGQEPDGPITPGTVAEINGGDATNFSRGGGALAIEVMAVSGTLYGAAENPGHVSTPPRYYRTATGSGAISVNSNGTMSSCSASGAAHIDDAGACTSYITNTWYGNVSSVGRAWDDAGGGAGISYPVFIESATTCYQAPRRSQDTGRPDYAAGGFGSFQASDDDHVATYTSQGGGVTWTGTGQINEALSDEDSELALIDRLVSAASWATGDMISTALYPVRTARSVTYSKLRWRYQRMVEGVPELSIAGLKPLWWYRLTVTIERRHLPSTVWEVVETRERLLSPGFDGVATTPDWDEIVAPAGYEYRIASITFA
jgi:hypothetical protein